MAGGRGTRRGSLDILTAGSNSGSNSNSNSAKLNSSFLAKLQAFKYRPSYSGAGS